MATFKVTVRVRDDLQAIDQDHAFNTWVATAGTSDSAWELANQVAEALAGNVLTDSQHVYSVSITNSNVANGNQTRLVSYDGTRVATGSELPSWNTVKMSGTVSTGTRPSIWHIRMGLTEDDVTGQNLSAGVLAALASLATDLLTIGAVCNPAGAEFTSFTFDELVRNRQQGWHRRTRPGFVRGWVPA